jgi:hypothetical protein
MAAKATVFYADQLYGQFDTSGYKLMRTSCDQEIYNGAYVRIDSERPGLPSSLETHGWFRMDGTPVLDADVPPTLKALVLLMT